jgi:hypothetical protein
MRWRLLASLPFFTRNPFRPTYFLPTAAKSKHKMFRKHFEHLQDGLQGEIQGRIS